MSVPNIGPELPDPSGADDARKGNPALVYRDEEPMDEITAASTRASTVTHRFGGVRYGLTPRPGKPADGGESDSED